MTSAKDEARMAYVCKELEKHQCAAQAYTKALAKAPKAYNIAGALAVGPALRRAAARLPWLSTRALLVAVLMLIGLAAVWPAVAGSIPALRGQWSLWLAVLVFALYINHDKVTRLYEHPQVLWIICPLLLYWIGRLWMHAHRRTMRDDPLLFALTDRVSYIVVLLVVLAATYAA